MTNVRQFLRTVQSASRKPWRVVAFRAQQELSLLRFHWFNRWPRLEYNIKRWWSPERVDRVSARLRARPVLLAHDGAAAVQGFATERSTWKSERIHYGQQILDRQFSVLNTRVPDDQSLPWHCDWRYGEHWNNRYFRSYDYYERDRQHPYDVKLPWELSRLTFLPPLAQAAILSPEGRWYSAITDILADWESKNPLAHSIGWYSMEAAMRSVNLVFVLELLLSAAEPPQEAVGTVIRLLSQHGEFIERTLEYTDVRGNHYAAEVVSLLLIGLALGDDYPRSGRWVSFARKALACEIPLQYLADGVQFEKSIAYHRLVTELFMLGWLACERAEISLGPEARDRLHAACLYTSACRRPDGQSPNVGDNDSGHVLGLDPLPLRNHQPLLDVASVCFEDSRLKAVCPPTAAVAWLCGREGLRIHEDLKCEQAGMARFFADGGVVVSKSTKHFLWMDVGEVGMLGRGGHGHNDILSFEIALDSVPVFVDPGCSVYTGDPVLRNQFRSTASHNTLRVDGEELAPLVGMWNIGNHAHPQNVDVQVNGSMTVVNAGHSGYLRLADPAEHHRTVQFDSHSGAFLCDDELRCKEKHTVERFFHLAPGVDIELAPDHARLCLPENTWKIHWDSVSTASLRHGWFSGGYGHCEKSEVLVLKTSICGTTKLYVKLHQAIETE